MAYWPWRWAVFIVWAVSLTAGQLTFNPFDQNQQRFPVTTFNPLDAQPTQPGTPNQILDARTEEGWTHLYEYGFYDIDVSYRPWMDKQIDLDFFFPFFGFRYNYTFIFPEGFLAFSFPYYIQPPYSLPNPYWPDEDDASLIAAFMTDQSFMAVGRTRISHVWYRIVHRPPNMIGRVSDGFTRAAAATQSRFGVGNRIFPEREYRGQKLRTTDGFIEDPEFLDGITR